MRKHAVFPFVVNVLSCYTVFTVCYITPVLKMKTQAVEMVFFLFSAVGLSVIAIIYE